MNSHDTHSPGRIDEYFEITKRGSTLGREMLAGVSTFLSLAYILVVNPAILSGAGMNTSAVFFATAIASGLMTVLMGWWARLPFALAPGLEMNGFVAVVLVGSMHLSWQSALGAIFVSGLLCWLLSVLPIREQIVKSIPESLQANLAVSVGIFVAVIGGYLADILVFKNGHLAAIGSFSSMKAITLYVVFSVVFLLDWSWLTRIGKSVKMTGGSLMPGCFLLAILAGTVYCNLNGIRADKPAELSMDMISNVGKMDVGAFIVDVRLWPAFLVLFLIDFFGSIGKFIGLTSSTNLKEGKAPPRIYQAMAVDGIATSFGAWLGTSSIITYVESAVGITAGGRTGVVAIVCGVLLMLCVFLTPLAALVPVVATAGVLVYVGFLLLPLERIVERKYDRFDAVVGVVMGLISFLTFSLDIAMALGFGAYAFRQFIKGERNWWLMSTFILLTTTVILRFVIR